METNVVEKVKFITLIGSVQSGKTEKLLEFCYESVSHKIPVIYILRNMKADQIQLVQRIHDIYNDVLNYSVSEHTEDFLFENISRGIITCLCNDAQLYKLSKILKKYNGIYNLCIDEVDYSVKTINGSSAIEFYLVEMKQKAFKILGATATPFAVLFGDNTLTKIIKINPKENYKGINSLQVKYIKPTVIIKNYPDCDKSSINHVYLECSNKDYTVLLHTTVKEKHLHKKLGEYIIQTFPKFTVVIYNGNGIYVMNSTTTTTTKKKMYHYSYSISHVLQILKNQNCTHITIIAGHLASRGISFVSLDYKLHLTDQYLHPSNSTHGEYLLQSLRILGCYNDNEKLTLWCSEYTWECILEHNNLIELISDKCNNLINWREILLTMKFELKPTRKLTRKNINKDFMMINKKYQLFLPEK